MTDYLKALLWCPEPPMRNNLDRHNLWCMARNYDVPVSRKATGNPNTR